MSEHGSGAASTSKHIIVDLTGAKRCETAKTAEKALRQALEGAQVRMGHVEVRRSGKDRCLSGSASLADGEVKIEVWPETGYVAVDIFGAQSVRPELIMTLLMDAFGAREAMIKKSRSAAEVARLTKPMRWFQVPETGASKRATRTIERQGKARRAA